MTGRSSWEYPSLCCARSALSYMREPGRQAGGAAADAAGSSRAAADGVAPSPWRPGACLCRYGPPVRWTRHDAAGTWESRELEVPPPAEAAAAGAVSGATVAGAAPAAGGAPAAAGAAAPALPRQHSLPEVAEASLLEKTQAGVTAQADDGRLGGGAAAAADARAAGEERMRCGLVHLMVNIPLVALADGVHSQAFSGCGAIVVHDPAAGLGLVVVDRNTVAVGGE